MNLLIEMIFKGMSSNINFNFLKKIIERANSSYFVAPDIPSAKSFDEIIKVLYSNDYIDLVINTDELIILGKRLSRVFINLGRYNEEFEILFFFNLKDLGELSLKENIYILEKWAIKFKIEFNFSYYICQMDNADIDEYYFDSNGTGRLYDEID